MRSNRRVRVDCYRHPDMNVIAVRASGIPADIASKYMIVADDDREPKWRKIVVMEHVTAHEIESFLAEMSATRAKSG